MRCSTTAQAAGTLLRCYRCSKRSLRARRAQLKMIRVFVKYSRGTRCTFFRSTVVMSSSTRFCMSMAFSFARRRIQLASVGPLDLA